MLLKYGRPVAKCDPWIQRATHGWSVGRPMNSLCFAKNISEEKWTDNSADALKSYPWFSTRLQYLHCLRTGNTTVLHETIGMSVCTCVWIKRDYRLAHFDQFFNWFHGPSILLTDHPKLRRKTQSSIMSGPLGDPGFCLFRSTGIGSVIQNWCRKVILSIETKLHY